MPIDVLFIGNAHPHRVGLSRAFTDMASKHGLVVRFEMDNELYAYSRDDAIMQSKVGMRKEGKREQEWHMVFSPT